MPLVDPNTGMPIGDPTPAAGTFGGAVGMETLQDAGVGYGQAPVAYDLLANLPGVEATMGWNVSRVQNTIMKGPRSGTQNARGFRQTFSPMAWGRLARPENIDPTALGSATNRHGMLRREKGMYTPFNALARMGNFVDKHIHSKVFGLNVPGSASVANAMGSGQGGVAFSPGTFGRMAAGNKIVGMSRGAFDRRSSTIFDSIEAIKPGTVADLRYRQWATASNAISGPHAQTYARGALESTVTGRVSARTVGWVSGFETAGRYGDEGIQALRAGSATNANYLGAAERGSAAYSRVAARTDMLGRGAAFAGRKGMISGAARAAGPIGWMLLAHDVSKFVGTGVGHGINGIIAAGKSAQGTLNKPVFGMGFKDNQIAATSRARGVMAIQNSRLNARSVLGSEAAMVMAAMG